jgi:hypothetical protein
MPKGNVINAWLDTLDYLTKPVQDMMMRICTALYAVVFWPPRLAIAELYSFAEVGRYLRVSFIH